ncbi:T-lymphocyte surface antigen Ly-9-like isoform X2 [Hyla sarda]|uniref:T-lymphocyte surface antigen Ly-9-like isoform X2 n=1 Tax=Hyla sarda TaxID=327740 RepID=UPI0024C3220F|nr:T-lymphocyte surface antigen Ly-9-like isoform X2 [Hyla sarda]
MLGAVAKQQQEVVTQLQLLIHAASGLLCERSCGGRSHVAGDEGSDVIFQVDPAGVMGDITWFVSGNHFATSESGKNIKIRDNRYKGKVFSMEDGSLLMKNLARKDQGTYIGSTLKNMSGEAELCAMIYDVRVYGMLSKDYIEIEYEVSNNGTCSVTFSCTVRGSDVNITWESSKDNDINGSGNVVHVLNPDPEVIYTCAAWISGTRTSKSVTPWEYCKKGTDILYSSSLERQQKPEDYTAQNTIRIMLAACMLTIAGFIFIHHMKTEVVASVGNNG